MENSSMAKSKTSKKSKAVRVIAAPAVAEKPAPAPLPSLDSMLRLSLADSFRLLGFSQAHGYRRIAEGKLRTQRDGRRTFVTRQELQRYVEEECVQRGGAT
jgi:hypothetical protein